MCTANIELWPASEQFCRQEEHGTFQLRNGSNERFVIVAFSFCFRKHHIPFSHASLYPCDLPKVDHFTSCDCQYWHRSGIH